MVAKAKDLIKIPPGPERDKLYDYPWTGPYTGEPSSYETQYLSEHRRIWGKNSLATSPECYKCGSKDTEWLRQEWNICFNCLTVFTSDEALDYQCFLQEEQDKLIEDREWE